MSQEKEKKDYVSASLVLEKVDSSRFTKEEKDALLDEMLEFFGAKGIDMVGELKLIDDEELEEVVKTLDEQNIMAIVEATKGLGWGMITNFHNLPDDANVEGLVIGTEEFLNKFNKDEELEETQA